MYKFTSNPRDNFSQKRPTLNRDGLGVFEPLKPKSEREPTCIPPHIHIKTYGAKVAKGATVRWRMQSAGVCGGVTSHNGDGIIPAAFRK